MMDKADRYTWTIGLLFVTVLMFFSAGLRAEEIRKGRFAGNDLPELLRGMEIQDGFIPSPMKEVGKVHRLSGRIIIVHETPAKAYFGREGDVVFEKDSIHTLADSRCRIKFTNDDVISMAPDSQFSVDSYRDRREDKRKSTLFGMLRGKIKFYALKLFRYREMNMKVKTPTAIMGVRGTSFGVHVYRRDGERTEAGIMVADTGPGAAYLAKAGGGPEGKIVTDVFCDDGVIVVNGKEVRSGNIFRGETGRVLPIPEGYEGRFHRETGVYPDYGSRPEDDGFASIEAGIGDGELEEDPLIAQGDTGPYEEFGGVLEDQVDTVTEENVSPPVSGTGGEIMGVTALVYNNSTGLPAYPVYWSDETGLAGGIYAVDQEGNPDYRMDLDETSDGVEVPYFDAGSTFGDYSLTNPNQFQSQQGGTYGDYLTWGYWEEDGFYDFASGEVGYDAYTYRVALDNIWWIKARQTGSDYLDYLEGQASVYTYSGEAKGVYMDGNFFSSALTGDFSCSVDFGSRQVSDFVIDVGGSGAGTSPNVLLQSGGGTLETDGTFDIIFSSGSIAGDAPDFSDTEAVGTVAGPQAEAVGGLWRAHGTGTGIDEKWATGEFHGQR